MGRQFAAGFAERGDPVDVVIGPAGRLRPKGEMDRRPLRLRGEMRRARPAATVSMSLRAPNKPTSTWLAGAQVALQCRNRASLASSVLLISALCFLAGGCATGGSARNTGLAHL